MTPATFPQADRMFGENQPEYLLLPAHFAKGVTTVCWELSDEELVRLIRARRIWVQVLTPDPPVLQPLRLAVDCPLS